MSYIDSLTDVLATIICQYLRAESRNESTESVPDRADNQSMEKGIAGRDAKGIRKTEGRVI